jgi:cytochrome c553
MKKEILIATSVAALLFTGCFNSETGASQRAANEASESHAPAKHEAKVEKTAPAHEAKAAEPVAKAEAPAPAAKEEKAAPAEKAATAEVNTAACAGCHGANFEKKAMGVSKEVNTMSKADIVAALKGYKDGSYGGSMKALMKGQVAALDDATIEAIANKVGK